jgi:glutathione synthase/RimK-type ligase-like ATP-grasp enzyme
MNLIFATCDHQPLIAPDDAPFAEALRARGISVTPIPWTEIDPYAVLDAPPIVLRSTWDYHRVPTLFQAWLESLADSGRTVWNNAAIARGNIDKVYLRQFEVGGIAIPHTRWLDRIDNNAIEQGLTDAGWDRAVFKPRIAATAYGTFLVSRGVQLSNEDLAPARASGALLQEFIPAIEQSGEISLVYIDGVFSHAVSKHAKPGDFRVQQDFGGSVTPINPSLNLLAFADRVMTQVNGPTLYARVDVVETPRGTLLMELELIEPELYFTIVESSASTLADAILARLA